ncbi:helix-turn-helix domain-containing protein [uncultured Tenacibaculum sp.]|uniref:helix-turn-helix domain-containing protein n=1 Tax=uncultured Tenacibaculum sp. TaxID=174713 RepID=UPI002627C720|nr:helix-turn-helix domain-containing protein [uncultured Tenacibaculum sp.]
MESITLDFNMLSVIDVLSIATALMLGFLFITLRSKNQKANWFLGLFLWSLAIEVLGTLLESVEFKEIEIHIIHTSLATISLLFLYVRLTFNLTVNVKYILLLIPFLMVNLFLFPEEMTRWFEYFFNGVLLVVLLKSIKDHQEKIKDYYSDIENKSLNWIKTIVFIYLFFYAFWIIEEVVGIANEEVIYYFASISTILTFFMIYWIAYNGFSQTEIFKSKLFIEEEVQEIKENEEKETNELFQEITLKIQEEKMYANQNLTLRLLSENLGIKEKELSKLINHHTQKNFYYFINKFRVEAFKKLLSSKKAKQLSLLGLANEAGFSSKSTFYAVFKNIEGITPKQYQNQLKKSE